jgi:uncharacterized protein (DUF2249 family)/hemerythrin-like domain-containing protein
MARELDLRRLPPELRHGLVFQTFDALAPGESLVIVNDHDPAPLLQQFRFVRPGLSAHEYLEQGPAAWQVRIARTGPARAEAPSRPPRGEEASSVSEYLEADHRRLDAILPDGERLVAAGSYAVAAARFADFSAGLDRHIELEEQILFPTFESATGMTAGPTEVMRSEHVAIRSFLRLATESLAQEDAGRLAEALGGLAETLSGHNMKEEHMLYPMTDQVLGSDERRREFVRRLAAS